MDAVVEVPYGAHPCSLYPRYNFDRAVFEEYARVSRTPEGTKEFLERYAFGVSSHSEYVSRVGGEETLRRLHEWS